MAQPVVCTERLTKDFPAGFWQRCTHRALDALTLQIPAGGIFGLLGPNGAGKTTTLKLLLGLLRPTGGRAELLGRPPGDLAARARVGFLPEQPAFYDHLTAEELLSYFAGLFGLSPAARHRRASVLLDRVGIGADRRRPLRQYSKGMLQRVGLAQALLNEPEVVIMDEPMAGLDPAGRREVRQLMLDLRDEGRTVIFSSHILSDAELLCSRVAILSGGRLRAEGSLAALTAAGSRGAEIVVARLPPSVAERLTSRVRRVTTLDEGRFSFEIAPGTRPEPLIAELAAAGAELVSVTPLRITLEDVFVQATSREAERAADHVEAARP